MNSHERRILTVTCFGHFLSHFNMLTFPAVLLPLADRLNMPMVDVLGHSFWMYLLFGITALPWGIAADRWHAGKLLFIFYFGAGLSGLAGAVWMDTPHIFALCLAGIGLFSGIYHPTGLGLISKEIDRISMAMGYNGMFGNLGLATAPLITGVVNWLWGPRTAYVFLAALNLCGAFMIAAYGFSESTPMKSGQKSSAGENGLGGAFLILLVAMMLGGIAYRGATVILPAYFELKNQGILQSLSQLLGTGLSPNLVATGVTSVIFLIGMLGQFSGGKVAEKFNPTRCYLVFHALTVPLALSMSVLLDLPLVIAATLYFFFLLGMQPIENTLVAKFTPKRFHHSAYGTKFVLTFGIGALAVKLIKTIESSYRIEAVFLTLGIVSAMLVCVILILMFHTRKSQSPSSP